MDHFSRINSLLPADKYALLRKLRKGNKPAGLESLINEAEQRKTNRINDFPVPTLNSALPIYEKREEIIKTLAGSRVCIITGETGSGKTTQLPLLCLLAGKGKNGKIGCTQPRRIAALTVADRLREEIGDKNVVGHAIRFDDSDGPESYIKVMTDGILLAESQRDPWLNEYETIIIDEAHERSLNIDFLLGIFKKLLEKRKNLSLIITSATIDTMKFSKAFDNAPVIEVSGRMYPVNTIYAGNDENDESALAEQAADAYKTFCADGLSGDVLAFFPTEQDIREFCEIMSADRDLLCLPLYARLPASSQKSIFEQSEKRKIIAATNIAETSITVPGIRYVIDTGLARISSYSPNSRTTLLPVKKISRSSADQRMGRCGRTANGVCIRLYSEQDYNERELFTAPEIQRQNLAEVLLKMHSLKINNPDSFPFIDKPKQKNISEGYRILAELGALEKIGKNYSLTARGRQMAHLPLDPKLSRILLEAAERSCLNEAVIVVSVLAIQDPRERPQGKEKDADLAHRQHTDPDSDFLSLLNLWELFQNSKKDTGLRRFCRDNFLSFRRMREWLDIRQQISRILAERKITAGKALSGKMQDELHKSILTGFIAHIAVKKHGEIYTSASGRELMIFPGSAVFGNGGEWIMSADQVETSRLFARTVANISPAWIEEAGKDLVKKTYTDVRWESKNNQVRARMKQSIFGMPLSADSIVGYGDVHPEKASEIFIREALVAGNFTPDRQSAKIKFLEHNRKIIRSIKEMENKQRRRDLLTDEETLFRLYFEELRGIWSFSLLEKFISDKPADFLCFGTADLMLIDRTPDAADFPDTVIAGNTVLDLKYEFIPESGKDGLTFMIPLSESARIDQSLPDWLVPGMLEEKVLHILKGLPRPERRKLVPLKETVQKILGALVFGQGSLYAQLSELLIIRFSVECSEDSLKEIEIPDYLKARIALVDSKKKEIKSSRNKAILQEKKQEAAKQLDRRKSDREQTGLETWPVRDFSGTVRVSNKNGIAADFFPGLAAENGSVSLRLFPDAGQRDRSHLAGTVLLAEKLLADQLKMISGTGPASGRTRKYMKVNYPETNIAAGIIKETLLSFYPESGILSGKDFDNWIVHCRENVAEEYAETLADLEAVIDSCIELESWLRRKLYASHNHKAVHDYLQQRLDQLLSAGGRKQWLFFSPDDLRCLRRYVKGLRIRIERGISDPRKDREKESGLADIQAKAAKFSGKTLKEYLLLVYDFELALFAPEVKGRSKVSLKSLGDFPR